MLKDKRSQCANNYKPVDIKYNHVLKTDSCLVEFREDLQSGFLGS